MTMKIGVKIEIYIPYVCIFQKQKKNNNVCLIRKSVTGAYPTFLGTPPGATELIV